MNIVVLDSGFLLIINREDIIWNEETIALFLKHFQCIIHPSFAVRSCMS